MSTKNRTTPGWMVRAWRSLKFSIGCRLVTSEGFSVVRMVTRDGTEYLQANDGSLLRIGAARSERKRGGRS